MSDVRSAPLAGVLRVLYLIAILAVTLSLVTTGVFSFYERPTETFTLYEHSGQEEGLQVSANVFAQSFEHRESGYWRNVGLILTLTATTMMAAAIVGLGAKANALRCGLLFAGVGLFSAGVVVGFSGSDNWLTMLTSALAFAVLAASFPALEDGLPMALGRGGG
jgi:hypothetical protein